VWHDRRLSPEETKLIQEHLHLCDACSREFVFEGSVIEAVREKLRRVAAPPDLIARISEQIRGEQDDG